MYGVQLYAQKPTKTTLIGASIENRFFVVPSCVGN